MFTLVTRPLVDAEPLIRRLSASGLEVLHVPVMTIKPVAIAAETQAALRLAQQQQRARLVFTSANGVRMLLAHMPDMTSVPCFCVGVQTAECADRCGFDNITVAGGDVVRLLETITSHGTALDTEWFHLRGRDHHGGLVSALQQKNYSARGICGYTAEPVASLATEVANAIAQRGVQSVLLYSPRTARLFEALLERHNLLDYCRTIRAYGLSQAVLQTLQAEWWQKWSPPRADAKMLEARVTEEGKRS